MKGWWLVVSWWWSLVGVLVFTAVGLRAQAPGPALVSPVAVDPIQRVADLIAQSAGPYKPIAPGIWETTYKGKNLPLIRVRIAAAEEGVFFIVPLISRDKLALSQAFLLRIAEFNAEYDYVKLALDKTSLVLRLDTHAARLDAATFSALEGQAALAADEAYALVSALLPATP